MPDLAALQGAFAAVLRGAEPPPGLLREPPDLARRLAVYRGNSDAAARKALAGAYPVLRQLVGEDFFVALAAQFRRAVPPDSGDLNLYGAGMAAFLEAFEHTRSLPWLPDVARLEWALHRAHYAADAPPFDPGPLAAVPAHRQGDLRPRLHPACAIVSSAYPVARIWTAHQPGHEGGLQVDFTPGPHHALVQRPGLRALVAEVEPAACAFLRVAAAGGSLACCLDAALCLDAGFDLGPALSVWVEARVLVGFEAAPVAQPPPAP